MGYDREKFSGYLDCPLCAAEVPISDEENTGEDIFCPYCQSPLMLKKKGDAFVLEEDF